MKYLIYIIFVLSIMVCCNYSGSTNNGRGNGANPCMPGTAFIPDGEPRVFEDPDKSGRYRVYIYGSRDEITTDYCGYGYDVWSAPVEDLTKWTNHGEVYHMENMFVTGYTEVRPKQSLAAPDCIYNPIDGLYYLYFFNSRPDPVRNKQAGFATSTRPDGPFIHPKMCNWPWTGRNRDFDPAILVDEDPNGTSSLDGKKYKIYAYWGFGVGNNMMAELVSDPSASGYMTDIIESTLITAPEGIPDYFEGPSIRKVGDKYVLVYSANGGNLPVTGRAQLFYSYSDHPLGPWTYGNMIASNSLNNMPGGNDHGGIFLNPHDKKWYINYHRPNPNNFNRVAIMEPIDVNVTPGAVASGGKVDIKLVPLTTSGVVLDGLDAFRQYRADALCYREGSAGASGHKRDPDGLNPMVGLQTNSVIGYMYMNFGKRALKDADKVQLRLNIKTPAAGHVELYISEPSNDTAYTANKIGEIDFGVNNRFYDLDVPVTPSTCSMPLTGKRGVFVKFTAGAAELKEIAFVKGTNPIPNPKRNITISPASNGSIEAIPAKARVGESVKLIQKPDAGYTYRDGTLAVSGGVPLRRNGDGTYEFKMPNHDIVVSGFDFFRAIHSISLTTTKPDNKLTVGDTVTVTVKAFVEIKDLKVRLGGIGPVEGADNGDGKGYLALNPVSSNGGKTWTAQYIIRSRDVFLTPDKETPNYATGMISVNCKTTAGNAGGYDDHYGNHGFGYKVGEITETTDGSSYLVSTGQRPSQ